MLIINGTMFVLTLLLSTFNINLDNVFALYYFKSHFFKPYQFITYMFMHGGFMHLFFNMFALFMFGVVLESIWGTKRFLTYYILTGLGAAVFNTLINWYQINGIEQAAEVFINNPGYETFAAFTEKYPEYWDMRKVSSLLASWSETTPEESSAIAKSMISQVRQVLDTGLNRSMLGASGAVFGLLLAFGMMFPNRPMYIMFIPVPIKAKFLVIGYGAFELYNGVFNTSDGIAHFAHLGGLAVGIIIMKIWQKKYGDYFKGE